MGKLLDKLREEHGIPPAAKRYCVGFLAHSDEIAEALQAGWTVKQIWAQMIKSGTVTMSYVHFCRLVRKYITSAANDEHGELPPADKLSPSSSLAGKQAKPSVKDPDRLEKPLTEKERLDRLKEEAFKSVRSPKPTGPPISKPKSREEENRELFGES